VFAVVKGKVIVRVWQEGPRISEGENFFVPPKVMVDESVITPGHQAVIQAGYWHMFEAVEDSEVVEVYLAALAGTDIERRTQGGKK
jgi:quercetin dioxygenase-like cupin family protein